jgi:SAM-dependent methyltransferase
MGSNREDHIAAYNSQAERLAAEYEALDPTDYRNTFASLLPRGSNLLALDVGAGSGRDAAWLAGLGFEVVAAEPATGMRSAGQRLHSSEAIRWIDDRLPALNATHALGLSFNLVLLSAVWQHVPPGDRRRAFRKLVTLLKPGGLLVVTLRLGPAPADRPMHEVSLGEMELFAREHGLLVVRVEKQTGSNPCRPGVDWITIAMVLPDDGAGALPLLRGIILGDDKSATYKLGLLRAIAKVADLTPGLARPHPTDDAVELPLGAVALNWLRMYVPLVGRNLPQMPGNSGPDGLGFAKAGFRSMLAEGLAPLDLRVGSTFTGDRATAVTGSLREACRTIARMPANFTRYPNSTSRVFDTAYGSPRIRGAIALDAATLAEFGTITVPGHVWRAMQRLGAWIEPVLVSEWARMIKGYAERQGAALPPGVVEAALEWIEPIRDVRSARELALGQIASGIPLKCIWSDRLLTPATLDVDHCLPWSAWACGDLWNLFPAHRVVNQRQKRDLLPSANTLALSRQAIQSWWDQSWCQDPALHTRFAREAEAALPIVKADSSEAVFEGLSWRRLRLQQDQRLPEWAGASPV